MDSIDITDSTFSLDVPDINNGIQVNSPKEFLDEIKLPFDVDKNLFVYIGIAVLVSLIGFFVYNYYKKKSKKNVSFEDCPGGFCTMEQSNA
jgi:hypothetical protein